MKMCLSIIIPAYNEECRIAATLRAADTFVTKQSYASEVIVVDDGSKDSTAQMVRSFANSHTYVHLIRLKNNRGKGSAVRAGMLTARGRYRLFMDADNSTTIEHADVLLRSAQDGADVVVGSRHVEGSIIRTRQNIVREVLGWLFRALARTIAPTGVRDTQNGFKMFRDKAAHDLFADLSCNGWAFDIEVLRKARSKNLRIAEVPITWVNDGRSKMRFLQMIRMLADTAKIAWQTK